MAMKRILPDIGAMLREGHFGDPKAEMPPLADPVTVTQMVMEVSRIEPYDRNPRQEANPRYAEIKESIRAQRGLNNALEITRRHGSEQYMIRAGGNTRLQILKELLAETGDSAFAKVHCLFHPWTSDTDVLTAHMIENELRGEMSLIDKALGLQALKAEIEAETGEQLSRSELVRKLADAGYTISRRHLIRFQYTAEVLYPLIPTALRSGMGRPQIDALRALETAFQSYWTDAGRESDRFQTIWKDALLMVDGPDFDVTLARQNLETRISGMLGHPVSRIRIAVDALLSGRAGATDGPDDGTDPAAETEPLPDVSSDATRAAADPPPNAPLDERPATQTASTNGVGGSTASTHAPNHETSIGTPDGSARTADPSSGVRSSPGETPEPSESESEPGTYTGPTDLKSLRARNYVLALQIAQRTGLGDQCIRKLSANGMGFLVDVPVEPVTGNTREDHLRRWLWWFLFSLTEFSIDQDRAAWMITHQVTPPDYLERDQDTFVGRPPDIVSLVRDLLSSPALSNRDFHALSQLMGSCRMARQLCPDKDGEALWKQGWYDGREARR
ncbi:MAG: hypothetical protein R6U21_04180 [Thermoplasmatota archaeon]